MQVIESGDRLDHHAALIYTMVLVSAAEERVTDEELEAMTRIVRYLPIFRSFDKSRIMEIGRACVELLRDEDGLDVGIAKIKAALPPRLRETAYALACDIVAADGLADQYELRLLEMLRYGLEVDRLVAAGIERGARARHQQV
ncbi:MAG: tellurite resistance TerB family protein [Geminicoccaceae bacterium]|nr:tellurite resistance TerB family protein [Geminicoccaceae bacterium]